MSDPDLDHRFRELFLEHSDQLYRLGMWLSKSHHVAEELVQEAALKAYRSFDSFRPDGNFKAWISRILTNSYIDRYRKQSRAPAVVDFQEYEPEHQEPEASNQFTADELDAFSEHVDDSVKEAVERLPDHLRIVFLLFGMAEFSYQRIADTLEIPMGTVMSRLYRARQQLKNDLREYAEDMGLLERTSS